MRMKKKNKKKWVIERKKCWPNEQQSPFCIMNECRWRERGGILVLHALLMKAGVLEYGEGEKYGNPCGQKLKK